MACYGCAYDVSCVQPISSIFGIDPLDRVQLTRFLGVIPYVKLTWDEHIQHIRNKVSKGIGILSKVRHVLNSSTCASLYIMHSYSPISRIVLRSGCNFHLTPSFPCCYSKEAYKNYYPLSLVRTY